MLKHFIKHKRKIALTLLVTILSDVFAPVMSYAVTSGPGQPEFMSFTPVEMNDIVDVSTGDFSYNIPLLVVPGPNGGYPINLNYHGGITVEQEASWVGLGWNINVGEITRDKRGLPDDFKGDVVTKETFMHPNTTIGVCYSKFTNTETFGLQLTHGNNFNVYYNSFSGLGGGYSRSLVSVENKCSGNKFLSNLNLSFDSQSGIGIQPGVGLSRKISEDKMAFHQLELNINSRNGIRGVSFVPSSTKRKLYTESKLVEDVNGPIKGIRRNWREEKYSYYAGGAMAGGSGEGLNFGNTYTPSVPVSMKGASTYFIVRYGKETGITTNFNKNLASQFYFSDQRVAETTQGIPAYGYQYLANRTSNSIMDFNRQNEFPVTKQAPALPSFVQTFDVYNVKAQGMGGSFRAHRKDIGVYSDFDKATKSSSIILGPELAVGSSAKIGGNFGAGYTKSYSGTWLDKAEALNNYQFNNDSVVFIMAGEQSAGGNVTDAFSGQSATNMQIKNSYSVDNIIDLTSIEPKLLNIRPGTTTAMLNSGSRDVKGNIINNIEYFTSGEIQDYPGYSNRTANILPVNSYPFDVSPTQYNYSNIPDHHIAAMKVRNPEGMVYEFAFPVINHKERDVIFSIDESTSGNRTVGYAVADASISNRNGIDHFYSASEVPDYVHSNLITAVYAPDYIDVTGNGPSDDDLGYFVKFNYSYGLSGGNYYKWRSPFTDANYIRNNYSNPMDDKAAYIYGEKEIVYLNSIETKTHIAVFVLEDRHDGYGAYEEHNGTNTTIRGEKMKYLSEIRLYSKEDTDNPVKVVKFEYDYTLCDGVPNSDNGEGKLTLKKVWFEYNGSIKGSLSPYEFTYNSFNPDYNPQQADRWGCYKPDKYNSTSYKFSNEDFPYVEQDKTLADQNASAWSLYSIHLPSGGTITFETESDDYAYVQDKKAMQMFNVVKVAHVDEGGTTLGTGGLLYDKQTVYQRVYFELPNPVTSTSELDAFCQGIGTSDNPMFFKMFMRLKNKINFGGSSDAYDYVDGYCETTGYGIDGECDISGSSSDFELGYIDVKLVSKLQTDGTKGQVHPFSKAAWEYLKMQRSDLLFPSTPITSGLNGQQILNIFTSLTSDILNLFGYYNHAFLSKFGDHLLLNKDDDDWHPSFIRLYNPDSKKLGGGIRVKKIESTDAWNISDGGEAHTYGTEYTYEMPDGTSSGVASYEPIIGGEEIPQHLPSDRYGTRKFSHRHKELYLEEPFCEEYYPAPQVIYRRVIVNALTRGTPGSELNKKTASGKSVYEFYTAKEFPVKVTYTKPEHKGYSPSFVIPYLGVQSFNNHGYTQGYAVWLNDMHGKLKAISTYSNNADVDNPFTQPTTKKEYIYQTTTPFNPNGSNYLKNEVTVLKSDGNYYTDVIGEKTDFAIDLIENSVTSFQLQAQTNVDMPTQFAFVPSLWPEATYIEEIHRSAVNVKVTQTNGVLIEERAYAEGSKSVMNYLMFDAKTGAPLLTSMNNDFNKPVYSYKMPAHWYYPGMGASSGNYRYNYQIYPYGNLIAGGRIEIPSVAEDAHFNIGDKLLVTYSGTKYYYWVYDVTSTNIGLIDEAGNQISFVPDLVTVVESGRKNHLTAPAGQIVSLSNPVTGRNFPPFAALNDFIDTHEDYGNSNANFSFTDCITGDEYTGYAQVVNNSGNYSIYFNFMHDPRACQFNVDLPFSASNGFTDVQDYTLLKSADKVIFILKANPAIRYEVTFDVDAVCIHECLDDVLHAEAYGYDDTWYYPYADVNAPQVGGNDYVTVADNNPWRYGKSGIWRKKDAYAYLVDRKKGRGVTSSTNIAVDGVYDNFIFFNWSDPDLKANNPYWTFTGTATRYNPYGYEIESRDALNIYSSALYGFRNAVATAVAANCAYFEMGYDGFEEYTTYTSAGHLPFTLTSASINTTASHTGKQSVYINTGSVKLSTTSRSYLPLATYESDNTITKFTPSLERNKYVVTAWFKPSVSGHIPRITVDNSGISSSSVEVSDYSIEGWYRVEAVFVLTGTSNTVDITLDFQNGGGAGSGWVDDIRVQPFKSGMKTYVYDPVKLWLMAELDDRNFATFYNYDEEGSLVQVKKETERGIMTIKQGRSNVKRN